jgi:tetratricopeptide (TPR) repeat protein
MDALRKAELQKQQGAKSPNPATTDSPADSLSLEPLAEPTLKPSAEGLLAKGDTHQRLPELPKRLEELDDQFFTTDPSVQKSIRALADAKAREANQPTAAKPGVEPASRAAAQNVFAAKQPTPAIGYGFAITVSVATLIAVAAIGSYFYWQLQPKGGIGASPMLSARSGAPLATPATSVAPVPPAASPTTPLPLPAPAAASISTEQEIRSPVKSSVPTRNATRETNIVPLPQQSTPSAPASQPNTTIRLSSKAGKADGTMERAHEAFARGDVELARSIWLRTLQTDSRNINALHGLAAIAQQEGRADQANALYRRVIEVDPKDAVAHAALFALNVPTDARQAESQLKAMLAEQPAAPQLNFALGNLYAAEARWAEAQQAYFKAHVADAANPDYLYNLAVSLDHLHQTRLAAQYYARALVSAKTQAAAFDPAQAEERMKILQSGRAD